MLFGSGMGLEPAGNKGTAYCTQEVEHDLRPPRPAVLWPKLTTNLLCMDMVGRLTFCALCSSSLSGTALVVMQVWIGLSVMFVAKFCRWETQGHLITLWEVLVSAQMYVTRRSLYLDSILFFTALILLQTTFLVACLANFRENSQVRLPPFTWKSLDLDCPQHGWLGEWLAAKCRNRAVRLCINFGMWVSYHTRILLFIYFGMLDPVLDDLRSLPNLDSLFVSSVAIGFLCLCPNMMVTLVTLPGLFNDFWNGKKASRAYRTQGYEVCPLDDDEQDNSELKRQIQEHRDAHGGKCLSLTVVIPCYMPNEEEILPDVLDYYKKQAPSYPGELKVMLVWNSPCEHKEFEIELNRMASEWPALSVYRNRWSTSKCDNLNMAIDLIDTEVALLNDADTMVSAETMCRASLHLGDHGYDIAQSHSTHCWEDFVGRPDGHCFAFGTLLTLYDSTKPLNMSTQGAWGHTPFNGRGGFWKVGALKKVGFDHRIIGEDHDAGYRGFACYGLRGIIDQNMLCQEREPPDCKSATSQRIRWETAALQMRRTFPWILRSPHYSKFEALILIWSQLCWNANLPLQQAPFQMAQLLPLAIAKSWFSIHVYGPGTYNQKCLDEDCQGSIEVFGTQLAIPEALAWQLGILGVYFVINLVDYFLRLGISRVRPRLAYILFGLFAVPLVMQPWLTYLQFWALYDYCWGGAKFICTARSSSSTCSTLEGSRNSSYPSLATQSESNSSSQSLLPVVDEEIDSMPTGKWAVASNDLRQPLIGV